MQIKFVFDAGVSAADQVRIREAIEDAFERGDILSCSCASVEVQTYETKPPDFQASISCACSVMRPLFSSTPDSDDD
jgi:hypothetical protein